MRSLSPFQLICVILGALFVSSDSVASNEVWALTAFMDAIYDDPNFVSSNWDALDADPCSWGGISCSPGRSYSNSLKIRILHIVFQQNLSSSSLKGFIAPELGLLSSLEKLYAILKQILHKNNFLGTIPKEISMMKSLKVLDLRSISFQVDSANANGFCRTSQLKRADFSFNFFVWGAPSCLKFIRRSSFQRNCFQDKNSKQRSTQQCGGTSPANSLPVANPEHRHFGNVSRHLHASNKPGWLFCLVIGIATGFLLLFAILTALLIDVVRWSRQELEVTCEDFSNIIGSSTDSLVYKGNVKDGPEIAVVSLCVADLARLNHENIEKVGYCRESSLYSRMLVFGYASNGTLNEHLHYGEGCHLSWIRRIKIIIGIAHGLRYLHTEIQPPFTISELNPSAVYLTEDFSPKICSLLVDFENWKAILARSKKTSGPSGNISCNFPDSVQARQLDIQGNTLSFGVLLLEIISGRPSYCKDRGNLVDWGRKNPELRHFRYDDLKVSCEVVKLCIHPEPSKRPSMHAVCNMLENRINTTIASELKDSPLA
ncbi:hypothetical protein MKX01_022999 [Papaver californicum]|nr:hypothetical protein MKX01_022999 [Papaver californicum]